MKSKISLIALLLLMAVLFDSCKKDNPEPAASASFTASKIKAVIGEEIVFTNTSTNAVSFVWSFGDGTISSQKSPSKSWPTAGVYEVTMAATGDGGSSSSSMEVTIVPPPALYFTDTGVHFIERVLLDGSGTMSNYLDVEGKGGVGLVYDSVHGKVYFSDYEVPGDGKIWVINFDGTNLHTVVTGIADDPYGMGLDAAGGHIYWGDDGGNISRANLDGTGVVNLITRDDIADAQFRSNVALDLAHSKMYFIDWWSENVWQADLDGQNQVIVAGVYGYGVFVDEVHNKLYVQNGDDDIFQMSDLDGSNVQTVDDTGGRIYGIAMDPATNKLYWSNYSQGEIYVSDMDGSNKTTFKSGLDSPRGIFLNK